MSLLDNTSLLTFIFALTTTLLAFMGVMLGYLQTRRTSMYNESLHRAVLSQMRESYENQLSNITRQIVATEERWREVNHLVVSGQAAQSKSLRTGGRPEYVSFLNRFGINENDLTPDPRLIFVLTPFSDEEHQTFVRIQKKCIDLGFKTIRGDEENAHGDILKQIILRSSNHES